MRLNGIFAAVTTPFDATTGDVDLFGFRRNAQFLLDTPLAGLVLFGSTGEGVLIEPAERAALLPVAREMAGDRTLLAGAGAESTRATIRLCRAAAAAGADAVLVHPPGYFRSLMTPTALFAHYTAVADASPAPVVLYQVPVASRSVELELSLIARLSAHPNIIGVKDSTGDPAALGELRRTCAEGFAVIVGTAAVVLDALDVGADAGILALAAIAPEECAGIYRLWQSGERDEAERVQAIAAGLHRAIVARFGVPGIKAALDVMGLAGGAPRPPLLALARDERAMVEETVRNALAIQRH